MGYSKKFEKFARYWSRDLKNQILAENTVFLKVRITRNKKVKYEYCSPRRYLQKQLQYNFAIYILNYMEGHDLNTITIHGKTSNIILYENDKLLDKIPLKKFYQNITKSSKNTWYEFLRFTKIRFFTYDSFLTNLLFDFDKKNGVISVSYYNIAEHDTKITYYFSLLNNSLDCKYTIGQDGADCFTISLI